MQSQGSVQLIITELLVHTILPIFSLISIRDRPGLDTFSRIEALRWWILCPLELKCSLVA